MVIPIVQAQERRRYIRFSGRWLIHYSILKKAQFDQTYTKDFSIGGISFETSESIPEATALKLKIRTLEQSEPIEVVGVVTRSDRRQGKPPFITAVRLASVSDQDWERLVNWAISHQRKSHSLRRSIM